MVKYSLKISLFFLLFLGIFLNVASAEWIKVSPCNARDFFHDVDSNAVYAVTEDRGVLKSTDGGFTWVEKNNGITDGYLRTIVSDGNGNLYLCSYYKFFKSANGGETWQETTATGFPVGGGDAKSMVFDSYTNKIFVVSNGNGLFQSADQGESWQPVPTGHSNMYSIYSGKADASGSTGMLLAGTYYNGIIKSTTSGDTWASKGSTMWMTDIISGPNDWLYAIGNGHIDRSKDFGESWSNIYGLASGYYDSSLSAYDESSGTIYVVTSSNDLLRSTDGGDTWDSVTIFTPVDGVWEGTRAVNVLSSDTMIVGTNLGIYRQGPAVVDTNQPPATPILVYPGIGSVLFYDKVNLHWKRSTDPEEAEVRYRLQIAEDNDFSENMREFELDKDGNLLVTFTSVLPLFAFLGWRSRSKRQMLLLTACGIFLATSFFVGCSSNGDADPVDLKNTVSFAASGLASGKTYYWRVVAIDDKDKGSDPSETWSFTTR